MTQIQYVRTNRGHNLQGFALGSSTGEVKMLLHAYQDKGGTGEFKQLIPTQIEHGVSRFLSHKGTVNKLLSTHDSRFLFSAGEDGTLFMYHIEEEKNLEAGEILTEKQIRGMAIEQSNRIYKLDENEGNPDQKSIMSPELANIVLVKKAEMEDWLSKQRQLKAELDATKRRVQAKLFEYK